MKVLVTGADGSLGSAISDRFSNSLMMPREIYTRERIVAWLAAEFNEISSIDAAVLNDGTNHLSWLGEATERDEEIIQRNVMAPYWTLNELVRIRGKNRPMRVVFITSQTYRVPQRTTALYCASKAAATMMMRVAARELAPHGWVINALAPGKIEDTLMSAKTDEQVLAMRGWSATEADKYAKALIPMGRFTNRAEIVDVLEGLLRMPPYVNGAVIEAFGGV